MLIFCSFVSALVTATTDANHLRSYDVPHDPYVGIPPTITQAALATSAAVSFFDTFRIGDRAYDDAGLGTKKPLG